ncbi:serine/threonine-protein kinase [Brachybacterium hainanense]|uniref:non-specific serine/threonine protein kinase n=1 Tax=Brachybacterium hainanense TaxID=1541174 RepID=A0ABV6RDN5_9MICO
MSRRPPSQPPALPGYQYEKLLGSGGFADVFLYRQARPQRLVAIKVLLASVADESVRRQFDAEANVMATMSTHPSIVTIHTADVSTTQRPFLVMEYCPRPNYGVRFRRERITVAEALRVGVQIAGAVETAHRAGILHRDIKPANILVTEYNRPALTDFGISIVDGGGDGLEDSQGMSIPWSPPEFFRDPPRADVRSDVFSLAATVYSLLAGRTPFETAGQRNTATDLIGRISSQPLAPLMRPDAPEALDRVLSIAMAKDPAGRYDSALSLGRALQQIEMAMSLPITQMDVLDERGAPAHPDGDDDELDAHTRIRKVSTIDPEAPPSPQTAPPAAPTPSGPPGFDPYAGVAPAVVTGARPSPASVEQTGDSTMLRPAAPPGVPTGSPGEPGTDARPAAPRRTPAWPFVLVAVVLVLGLGLGATVAARTWFPQEQEPVPTAKVQDADGGSSTLSPPEKVEIQLVPGTVDGIEKARVSWAPGEGAWEGDTYQIQWVNLGPGYESYEALQDEKVHDSHIVDVPPNQPGACIQVRAVRDDGSASPWTEETCLQGG